MNLLFANHRDAPSVSAQAKVKPVAWRVMEWQPGMRRVVCVLEDAQSVRLSSAIDKVDLTGGCVTLTTVSGRKYALNEPPVEDPSIRAMLHARAEIDHPGGRDVSDKYWTDFGAEHLPKMSKVAKRSP